MPAIAGVRERPRRRSVARAVAGGVDRAVVDHPAFAAGGWKRGQALEHAAAARPPRCTRARARARNDTGGRVVTRSPGAARPTRLEHEPLLGVGAHVTLERRGERDAARRPPSPRARARGGRGSGRARAHDEAGHDARRPCGARARAAPRAGARGGRRTAPPGRPAEAPVAEQREEPVPAQHAPRFEGARAARHDVDARPARRRVEEALDARVLLRARERGDVVARARERGGRELPVAEVRAPQEHAVARARRRRAGARRPRS